MSKNCILLVVSGNKGVLRLSNSLKHIHPSWLDLDWIIYTEEETISLLSHMLRQYEINAYIQRKSSVVDWFKKIYCNSKGSLDIYKGASLNISPLYCIQQLQYDKVLLIEEDCLLYGDASSVLSSECQLQLVHINLRGSSYGLEYCDNRTQQLIMEVLSLGNLDPEEYYSEWYDRKLLGAPILFVKSDFDEGWYAKCLVNLHKSEDMYHSILISKKWHVNYLTERMLTMCTIRNKFRNATDVFSQVMCKVEKLNEGIIRNAKKRSVIHIVTGDKSGILNAMFPEVEHN